MDQVATQGTCEQAIDVMQSLRECCCVIADRTTSVHFVGTQVERMLPESS